MTICNYCDQEMTTGVGCRSDALHRDGVPVARVPNRAVRTSPGGRCGDCRAPLGTLHHPGCDLELCPFCHIQAITCDCRYDEDPPDDLGDEGEVLDTYR